MNDYSNMTAADKLNYFRNLYYADGDTTENGIIANALNEVLPRMILPPCKLGDKIYLLVTKIPKHGFPEFTFIKESRLTFLNMERVIATFGKTTFLTYKEAADALKTKEERTV